MRFIKSGRHLFIWLSLMVCCRVHSMAQTYAIPDANFRQFLKTQYPSVIDPLSDSLIIAEASSVVGVFNCSNQNIKDLSGIQFFTKIEKLICKENRITYIPSLDGNLDSLIAFDCSDNLLSQLPEIGSVGQKLESLKCSNNLLTSLPDKSLLPSLDTLFCDHNYFSFQDLLTMGVIANFNYAPQLSFLVAATVEKQEGETYDLLFPQQDTSTSNTNRVFRNGVFVKTVPGQTFTINGVKPTDGGIYTMQISNANLPALTLVTSPQELIVLNKSSEVFTPNGDNMNDSYFIQCGGVIRIYDRFGVLIKELQNASYWDGSNIHGEMLPTGAYIIRCGDEKETSVTIIR